MSYCTLIQAKRNNSLAGADSSLLQQLLDAATAFIDRYCGRSFAEVEYTEVHDGNDKPFIFVRTVPIVDITTVTLTDSTGTETDVDPEDDLIFDADTGRLAWRSTSLLGYYYWPEGIGNVEVVYTAGYETIPADIVQACCLIAQQFYAAGASRKNPGLTSERLGDYQMSAKGAQDNAALTPAAKALLAPYRLLQM